MALIKCKECGKEISTTAENCPYCGYRTAHGRSITERKGLLVNWIVCVVMIFGGLILILKNAEMFFEACDNLEYYKHWSDEGKEFFWKFVTGVGLLIGGLIDLLGIKKHIESIKGDGFELEKTAAGAPSADKVERKIPTWERVEMENEAKRKEQRQSGEE